ncbi:hypothetical protein Nepgr_011101 [Nepenthes gracilis]|uniref:Receptor ligand binding region domain-containing protein n=1 Tax=Nepenthes gracilis TaxID=150966 RepID=A0AAD3SDG1_NEPGR|nr:hypothetical protein Nepgr_011101 [Nepenthes gracilis]
MLEPLAVKGEARNVSSYFFQPKFVNIGSLFTFNSVAIAAALDDINSNSSILPGTKVHLIFHDPSCNSFLGIMEALQLIEKDVAVIIGPRSSGIARVISDVANELHVSLLTLTTNPTLSALQYADFLHVTQSDYFLMYAIADLVSHYRWSEVIAIYIDEANGRNGDSASGDALASKRVEFSYKAAFSTSASTNDISNLLGEVNMMESRVIVVHINPDSSLTIFSVANSFGMMDGSYVWIVTDWFPSVLNSSESTDAKNMNLLHGVLALSDHTPNSDHKKGFMTRCNLKYVRKWSINFYAFYAYDSVWLVAHALASFFNEGGNLLSRVILH